MPDALAENSSLPVLPSTFRSSADNLAEPPPHRFTAPFTVDEFTPAANVGAGSLIPDIVDDGAKKSKLETVQDDCLYGFFSRQLAPERREYLEIVIRPVILVLLVMWVCLPAYWGALSTAPTLTTSLTAWYINRDAARIGNTLWDSFGNTSAPGQQLGWINVDPDMAGSNEQVMNAIIQGQAWIAVVVEANATINLSHARANGDSNYDPTSAITVYYAQARQETAVGNYVLPITTQLLTSSVTAYTTGSAQRYFAQITPGTTVNQTAVQLLSQAPQTINPAIAWAMVNLRPYTTPVAQAVTLVGNIFLIIFSFIITMAHSAARAVIAPRLRFSSYLVLRILIPLIAYIPISMSYTLVNVAFSLPLGGKFSYGGGFMLTFVFVYLGMCALGLAIEAMITLLTPKFVPFFLFILIIFNISPTALPPELMNGFYVYGTGFPVWNLSQALRTILFNTHSDLGRNAGVMVAWICLSCGTLIAFTWMMHRRYLSTLTPAPMPPSEPRAVDSNNEARKGHA